MSICTTLLTDGGKEKVTKLEDAGGIAFQNFVESIKSRFTAKVYKAALNDYASWCRTQGLVIKTADDMLDQDAKAIQARIM